MSLKINLDGEIGNRGHVFIFDEEGKLRMKFWFHGDGRVAWRKFDETGRTVDADNIYALDAIVRLTPDNMEAVGK